MKRNKLPELLAPAGGFDAFVSAVSAGADAVYLGTARHNARIGAKNFNNEELKRAFDIAGLYGKKIYITLNTLVSDRELTEVLNEVESLMNMGGNIFIVQDLGLVSVLKKTFPDITIHASTQCVTHNFEQIKALEELGVSRAVVARELDKENLYQICQRSPIEIEVFVHGALCVCQSGGCLFSSLVGGRSGNRGECAQPCRLPYSFKGSDMNYPLSLSDLTLSDHITDLVDMGVTSLKIEGRMKSKEYVGGVVSVFRTLLDEGRNVNKKEKELLSKLFSRNGFTDGYFESKLGKTMFGVRSESDKNETKKLVLPEYSLPKIKIDATFKVTKDSAELEFKNDTVSAKASLHAPEKALTKPIDYNFAYSQISKLGDTPFELDKFDFSYDGDYIYPRSELNRLRREVCEKLLERKETVIKKEALYEIDETKPTPLSHYVVFAPHRRVTSKEAEVLLKKTDRVYFPLFRVPNLSDYEKAGVLLSVIVYDSQFEEVEEELKRLFKKGIKFAYAENVGVAKVALSIGFKVLGGIRLNVYNSYTAKVLNSMGFEALLLSAELSSSQKRDIKKSLPTGETVYGRLPLMIMDNCIMNLGDNCRNHCDFKNCEKSTVLTDRRGVNFPVFPEYFHRCQIYNSVPTVLNDIKATDGVSFRAIFITDEKDVIKTVNSVMSGEKPSGNFTRKG